jgi:hypothetical protein
MVFRYQQSFQEQKQKAQVYCKENHWVILNEKGQLSQLSIDSAIVSSDIDNFTLQAREYANYSIIKENGEYLIKNRDNKYIGKVPEKILRDSLGLFNEINLEDSDFERVTFIKSNNNWVTKNGKNVPQKWSLRLNINKVQDVDTNYYNENVGDFNANKRIFHTFRGSDGAHYIVRISDANLSNEASEPFVTFMIIRTAIVSKLN